MNAMEFYVEADSTNLPKVDTRMLFDFLKNGRKFICAEFKKDEKNLVNNKYGDNCIGYVKVLRNSAYCVVKAEMLVDDDNEDSKFPIRVLIHETKNTIHKSECKKCNPIECIHSFALLMWLHRRTEESVEGLVNYHRKPGPIFVPKKDASENELISSPLKSSSPPSDINYLDNNNISPETRLFLNEKGILTMQSSMHTSQPQQPAHQTIQQTSQESSSDFELSHINNSDENRDMKSSISSQPSPQKIAMCSTRLAHPVQHLSQLSLLKTSPKSSSSPNYGHIINSATGAIPKYRETGGLASSQPLPLREIPLSQITNIERVNSPKQNKIMGRSLYSTLCSLQGSSQKSSSSYHYSQNVHYSAVATRDYCESEDSSCTPSPPLKVVPLSQLTNTQSVKPKAISPKQNKMMRKAPYTPKSTKTSSPVTSKKQSLLSKKVSQLVKQPKIHSFFTRPSIEVDDSKPQIKNLYMGELVKCFLKFNKGTVEDFMGFAGEQMTDFLCKEAETLTRVQRTDLWMDLRYGRITASIINEAANCRTHNGSLVNKILGKVGKYQSAAMKRGIDLEDKILRQVQIQENLTTSSSGLFLIPSCPIIGASPDAIGSDFIVEIKAPSSESTFETFLPNGSISKKYKNQMYLQMYCTGMKKGIFCVADPNFEVNKKVTTVWLDYDDEFDEILEKAKLFWITAIFPRLVNM